MTEPNLGNQPLEPGTIERRGSGTAKIIVNDNDLLTHPAKLRGTIRQCILQAC
jgi:hypothetical protein